MKIGKRIKDKRIEKNLTQAQLGDLLGVTDKAVSKWEKDETCPDINLLPKISDILEVSLQYLLTGEEVKPDLEIMDKKKRLMYLLNKDDAINFIKYGYNEPIFIFSTQVWKFNRMSNFWLNQNELDDIHKIIYDEKKLNIFNACLDSFLKLDFCNKYSISRSKLDKPILFVLDNIDDYIMMCCYANRIDGLELIDFKKRNAPVRENHDKKTMLYTHDKITYYDYSFETLNKIYNDKNISKKVKDYVFEISFCDYKKNRNFFTCFDSITYVYYINNDKKKLKEIYKELLKYYKHNDFDGVNIYKFDSIFNEAIKNLDIERIEKINDYKKLFKEKYDFFVKNMNEWSKANIPYFQYSGKDILNDKQINYYSLKANPKTKPEIILNIEYTKECLLDVKKLIDDNFNKAIDADSTKRAIKKLESDIINTLFISPIYIYEYLLMSIDKKDFGNFNELFRNNSNYYKKNIQPLIENKNFKELKNYFKMSLPVNLIENFYEKVDLEANNSNEKYTYEKYKDSFIYKIYNALKIDKDICKLQFDNVPLKYRISNDPTLKDFKEIKKKIVGDAKENLVNKLESYTHKNELIERFLLTNKKYSTEKLLNYIKIGEYDIAITNLCTKLEIFIKAYYEYEGDFKNVLDEFIKFSNFDEEQAALLNKIRIKRNSIVHAENEQIEINAEEIEKAILFVENIINDKKSANL